MGMSPDKPDEPMDAESMARRMREQAEASRLEAEAEGRIAAWEEAREARMERQARERRKADEEHAARAREAARERAAEAHAAKVAAELQFREEQGEQRRMEDQERARLMWLRNMHSDIGEAFAYMEECRQRLQASPYANEEGMWAALTIAAMIQKSIREAPEALECNAQDCQADCDRACQFGG